MTSEKWAGFSDEDIERIKSNPRISKSCSDRICELDDYTATSKNRGPMKIIKLPQKSDFCNCDDTYEGTIFNEGLAKESLSAVTNISTLKSSDVSYALPEDEANCTCDSYMLDENQRDLPAAVLSSDVCEDANDPKCEDMDPSSTSLLPLEIFEMRQKRIESENARRRALISKAINDKKMQTQAEAIKLAKITQELNRIDSNLSADVSILRDYIEKASFEFSEAEKRYLKAEKEFVEAKLILFEKMQRKEMLTEHLCAIIEQNENRKADKLVELMKQLEMEVLVEDYETNGIQPILPNLCALNDEPYQSCQTIKPTLSRNNSHITVNEIKEKSDYDEEKEAVEVSNEITDEHKLNNINVKRNLTADGSGEEQV